MVERTMAGSLQLNGDWDLGEDNWKDGVDENWLKLSALSQAVAIDLVSATPVAPNEGDVYLFDEIHPTNANAVAVYDEGAWVFLTPVQGWLCYDIAGLTLRLFSGTKWEELKTGSGGSGGGPTVWKGARIDGAGGTDQAIAVNAPVAVSVFTHEVANEGGFGTSGSAITIPAGVSRVRVLFKPRFVAITAGSGVDSRIRVNGVDVASSNYAASYTTPTVVLTSPVLSVVEGDVISFQVASTDVSYAVVASFDCFAEVTVLEGAILNGTAPTESIIVAVGDEVSALTTGTAKVTFRTPYAFTLTDVRASLKTASSSGLPTVDINEGGVSVLSTKLTIDATEKTSTTATTAAVISDAALADDAEITIDVDVAGTGAAGLKVYLIGHQ